MTSDDGSGDVELRGITKRFGQVVAVDDISLTVRGGEFFALLGPSGSGKTTCLRLIAGFERPSAGRVILGGRDMTDVAPFNRPVNTVFQDYALFPHMTVAQNVGYGLMVRRVPREERRERVQAALDTVRLGSYGVRKPSELSGGQRQRVALARALINRPKVLLLDEPLGALDRKLREEMQIELKSLQREVGITFVFVTHDQDEALTMSDRIAVFDSGRIEQVGAPEEIYDRPASPFVADFVGSTNMLDAPAARRVLGLDGTYSLRPERIRVCPADSIPVAGEQSAEGSVLDFVYAGATVRHVVALDGGPVLVASRANTHSHDALAAPRRGDRVRLIWAADDALQLT
jgi:putative spermidine/putrescine transport system ATP-binding protein